MRFPRENIRSTMAWEGCVIVTERCRRGAGHVGYVKLGSGPSSEMDPNGELEEVPCGDGGQVGSPSG
jgi:hypothetical protein